MLGVVFIFVCILNGLVFQRLISPSFNEPYITCFDNTSSNVSSIFLRWPLYFISGTCFTSWLVYLLAVLFRKTANPLLIANLLVMAISILLYLGLFIFRRSIFWPSFALPASFDIILFILIAGLGLYLSFKSFNMDSARMYVGLSVFSDFTPHLSMIRSFSHSANFPTVYTVCSGSDVKYHFLFEFLVGNLEYLGLRLDYAFNLPSFLAFLSMMSLLFVLAIKLTGRRLVGGLTLLLTCFRSSLSLLIYLLNKPAMTSTLEYLRSNTEFIGATTNENWGLWNLNVYCNQRHYAFGLSILLIILIVYIPYAYRAINRIKYMETDGSILVHLLLDKEAWRLGDLKSALAYGCLLGATAFWNGATLIGTILILFFIAIASDSKLDILITALITLTLSSLQAGLFTEDSPVSAHIQTGFLSNGSSIYSILYYCLLLLGPAFIMVLIAFCKYRGLTRYLLFCFSTPFVMAFFLALTPDIAVNHKYIMISIMLFNIFIADMIDSLLGKKDILIRIGVCLLLIGLTSTGIYDFYILSKKNSRSHAITLERNHDITAFIEEHTEPEDLFCTSEYYINGSEGSYVLLSGARLYLAWPYFGWSAGYDTNEREAIVNSIYSADNLEDLTNIVERIGFNYIIVDRSNRSSDYYVLNEELIAGAFEEVFTRGQGMDKFTIYKTNI